MTPPPLPGSENEKSWAHQAAAASVVAPGLLILLTIALRGGSFSAQMSRQTAVIVGFIAFFVLAAGFILSVVAWCGIPRYGTSRILGRSILGFILNGLFLFIFLSGFVAGRKRALSREATAQEIRVAAREANKELAKSYDPEKGITNARVGLDQMQRVNNQLQDAARNATGDEAIVLQSLSGYLQRMQAAATRYDVAAQKYRSADVLSVATLNDKADLERRREAIRNLVAANNEIKRIVLENEKTIRADLEKRGLAAAKVDETIEAYRRKASARNSLILKIRECDQRVTDATLEILNLFESNWGYWQYDEKSNLLRFENPQANKRYNGFFSEIETAGEDQVKLQGQLLKMR